ncbi:hypothetical protein J3D55_001196 [Chryseobacterium ginsenosidimutans]|uniref:hypothetical protein n=1 Tax=Chryseobacterium ginsenosidimutans TaxID=687846 RepID=UPI0021690AC4|nr:hypothetical protein [Chryseobacterium ginsenosidimutans]MCS3868280.1 hypothetical protein [Chryseobacterium ginsenosidimutans]
MNLDKTLIIYDSIQYFVPSIEKKGVRCFPSFRKVNKIEKIFRKISFKTGIKKSGWYGDWRKHVTTIDTVIIFATNRFDFIEYLADNYPDIRIIVWYWNPVFRCFDPSKLKRKNIEYWSFDEDDCKKYNLKFNTTFYFDNIDVDKNEAIKFDVIFLGADKKRKSVLDKINKDLTAIKIKTLFHIVPDKGQPNPQDIKPLPYYDYLKLVSQSSCILDYIQAGQSGNTLRPMESIFFRKKLITNDKNIRKERFYDPANIFILDHDNFENINDFINGSYHEIRSELVNYYDFSTWLNRF